MMWIPVAAALPASLLLDYPVIAPQISLVALRGSLCKPIFAPLFRFRLLFLLPDSELSILGNISQELPPNLTSCPLALVRLIDATTILLETRAMSVCFL